MIEHILYAIGVFAVLLFAYGAGHTVIGLAREFIAFLRGAK